MNHFFNHILLMGAKLPKFNSKKSICNKYYPLKHNDIINEYKIILLETINVFGTVGNMNINTRRVDIDFYLIKKL